MIRRNMRGFGTMGRRGWEQFLPLPVRVPRLLRQLVRVHQQRQRARVAARQLVPVLVQQQLANI